MSGGSRSLAYTREWWGLVAASIVLTLICYGAVLRQQLGLAHGQRPPLLDSVRRAAMDVPGVLVVLLALAMPLAPAMLWTAWRGFDVIAAALTLAAAALLLLGWFAWPALVAQTRSPLAALAMSARLVRGRWRQVALTGFALLAAVVVFAILIGVLIGMVMHLAGQGAPDAQGLAVSRSLMALILAIPVVYGGAVTVSAWRALLTPRPAPPAPQPDARSATR